ncbi:MAG: TonB-dependent receptor [Gammaproteobacteria bacterium]|nr:TonB-dependent receptor [Gammaproteobacteria bacterium]
MNRYIPLPPGKIRPTVMAIVVALCPITLNAEETTLSTVVVNAPQEQESAAAATSIDTSELRRQRASSSDSALLFRDVPGVNFYRAGGVSSLPVVHGLADDRLRTKVDGMDLISACGNHMNPPLSYLDPHQVEQITLFTGVAPVSLGGDSIGATINVKSKAPQFAKEGEPTLTNGEAGFAYRSNNSAMSAHLMATAASDSLSVGYEGATTKADNYHAGGDFKPAGAAAAGRGDLDADEVGSSMFKSTNQALTLALRNEAHLLSLRLGTQDIPYQGWPNQRMDMTGNDSKQINLNYLGSYEWGDLDTRIYRENTRHKMQFFDDKLFWYGAASNTPTKDGEPCQPSGGKEGCAAGMPMDTEGENNGVTIKGSVALSEQDLLHIGGEMQQYRLDDWWDASGKGMWPNTYWNIRDGERDRLALFSEWERHWNPQWLTLMGVRHEQVSMNSGEVAGYNPTYSPEDANAFNAASRDIQDSNLDLALSAQFTPSPTATYGVGIARKNRSPNLYERYSWSTHGMSMRMINLNGDGNGYVGNLQLEPETANTLSLSADWHDPSAKGWGIKLAPYVTRVNNYIAGERCNGTAAPCDAKNIAMQNNYVYLRYANQEAKIYGVDLSGFMPVAKTGDYGDFTLKGMVNYLRGENSATDDNLYNMMPLNSKISLQQQQGAWFSSLEWQWVDTKDRVSATYNEVATASYSLLHLRAGYAWQQFDLEFGIENLADKAYADPLGGAYTGQGKTMSANDVPWGTAVPGMGRSIYTAVNMQF